MEVDLKIIKEIVSDRFKINISKRSREINYIKARAIYCELAYKYSNNSYDEIGKSLGNRTHATILHARKTFASFNDEKFLIDYKHIKKVLFAIFDNNKAISLANSLDEELEELNYQIIKLKKDLINANELVEKGITKYKEINDLLKLDDDQIQFACETRLKPFLKMQESKITNKDLIQKQILTRTM